MSFHWLSKPLSIQSIASQYTLPIVIQPALGFHGSNRPLILHSILNITFAYGRAVKLHQSKKSHYQSFVPINSELVAVPVEYPGYFECLLPSRRGPQDDIVPIKTISSIVEQMNIDHRPQAFYLAIPLHAYTLEKQPNGDQHRIWHEIIAHQVILFNRIIEIEYTPTENDNLTGDDYTYSWWFCFYKQVLNRNENVIECILPDQTIYYIPCLSTDEVCLIPVGQTGSTNASKLQTIQNIGKYFSLPINIKLAQLPGSDTYKDFSGYLQLLGIHTEEFAICGSLSSTNVSLIPVDISLEFLVAPIPLSSIDIQNQISRCDILNQSFTKQIRRIIMSTNDHSRSKSQSVLQGKRSSNNDFEDDVFHSELTTEKRRQDFGKNKTISVSIDNSSSRKAFKRTLSTGDKSSYNSLVHPVQTKAILKQSSLLIAPPLHKKSSHSPHQSTAFTYDTGSILMKIIDSSNTDGAILIDKNNKLFSILTSEGQVSKV